MSQKAYYCQLLLRNQISLSTLDCYKKKSKASIALVSPPNSPDHPPLKDSDHTRDDVRTQSSKDGSLYYRTKTTSRSD